MEWRFYIYLDIQSMKWLNIEIEIEQHYNNNESQICILKMSANHAINSKWFLLLNHRTWATKSLLLIERTRTHIWILNSD